jgi:hypothetical protein
MKTVGGPARFLVKNLEGWAFSGWLPRQDFFTKEIRRLLAWRRKWSQPPVLPWAERAYETCLSAGSTAWLAADRQTKMEPPSRNSTELAPTERGNR